ncbi:MAG: hypothetical protein AB7N91_32280 [Candidatus Tectimicrobiota bacterium]
MRWIAPPEKDTATVTLEKRLWDAADQFRANSGLKAHIQTPPQHPLRPCIIKLIPSPRAWRRV